VFNLDVIVAQSFRFFATESYYVFDAG